MRNVISLLVSLALVVCGIAASSAAQGVQTGTLRGAVLDQQSAPIPGATVTAASPALLAPRTAISDEDGFYVFRALPPGDYTITVAMPSFAEFKRTVTVPLGGTVEQVATLQLATVQETVSVLGTVPPPLAAPAIGLNIKREEVEALATSRTLFGIATLSPGLNENTPNTGQVAINGAFAFDNIFMVNGVDVNDNLFGSPQNLFIEDAIQETQVLTSGISAEYGRFSGGVINAVTKSGGNAFSGSYRLNLTNPSWVGETPFEKSSGTTHDDVLNKTHEATLGGPIARNHLWFFGAGRLAKQSVAETLLETGVGVTQDDDNKRGEIKFTGNLAANHTLQVGYLNNARTVSNTSGIFDFIIDQNSLITRKTPNSYYFTNYRGIIRRNLLAEAQYSQRKFGFEGDGGTSTDLSDSPFSALSLAAVYNAPYFDATDPETRNNRQLTGNLTYFFERGGRHEVKGGYEFFRSQQTGGNSQSSTNYVFDADYVTDAAGAPVLDATNRPIPVFTPGASLLEHWLPVRGAALNVDNNSLYAQDHWTVNPHLSADLGIRYERVRSEATGGVVGVDTDTVVPRLALGYDVNGDGKHVVHLTYGHYSGRYNEAQIGSNSNVGNPDETVGIYTGPAGQGRSFAPGLNPANYRTVSGSFPTANIFFADGLSSPISKEFTASYGADLLQGKGYAEASYIWRDMSNFIEDYIDLSNGVTDVVKNGIDAGTFTNVVYRNTNDDVTRKYRALVFQGRYTVNGSLTLNGNLTVELKNEGNYEGEAISQPGLTSIIGDYPEAFSAARNYPLGRLPNFERSRARVWAIYSHQLRQYGSLSISGIVRAESAQSYSLRAASQPLTEIQEALLSDYPDLPSSQPVYFAARGSELFKGYAVLDASLNYDIPVVRNLRPFFKFDVFNLLNNDKQVGWNTTVSQDAASPKDALGLATGYLEGARFGQATSNTNFPQSIVGAGLRGFRVAMGIRF